MNQNHQDQQQQQQQNRLQQHQQLNHQPQQQNHVNNLHHQYQNHQQSQHHHQNNLHQPSNHNQHQTSGITHADLDLAKLQNLRNLNALKFMQQLPTSNTSMQMPAAGLSNLFQTYSPNQLKNWQLQQQNQASAGNDANLDRVARFHRSSAGNSI